MALLVPLYLGAAVVINESASAEAFAEAVQREQPGWAFADFDETVRATREAKRAVKGARGILQGLVLATSGVFEPGDRQRVGKSFRCPAITTFGLPETGLIFASHPQWYLDESVGIPITNAHVVPADPRTGTPISTLWELVESAEVTVAGPHVMCGYENEDAVDRFVDKRFRTGVIASSDANGMIYLLPE